MQSTQPKAFSLFLLFLMLLTSGCYLEREDADVDTDEADESYDEADQGPDEEDESAEEDDEKVRVSEPDDGETIDPSQGLTIQGEARGTWFFEGNFAIKLVDMSGNLLIQTSAVAMDDWMTTDWVTFEATLDPFGIGEINEGKLIFEKANASGLPENDDSFEITVKFGNSSSDTSNLEIEKPEFDFSNQIESESGVDATWDLKENKEV
jgi:hypothetical protein